MMLPDTFREIAELLPVVNACIGLRPEGFEIMMYGRRDQRLRRIVSYVNATSAIDPVGLFRTELQAMEAEIL